VLSLVIFAGFTMFDLQRLRSNTDVASASLLAASIFLDVLNAFPLPCPAIPAKLRFGSM
jgi:FtsH-binding integral membrane protein